MAPAIVTKPDDQDKSPKMIHFVDINVKDGDVTSKGQRSPDQGSLNGNRREGSIFSYPKGVYFCMVNELFERFTFYAIMVILTFYLRSRYEMEDSTAKLIFHGFVCLCFFTPIIGSVWSDGFLGPYKVVVYLLLTYCLGMVALTAGSMTLSDHDALDQFLKIVGVVGLLLVALASGGRKPCVPAFAADQFPEHMSRERQRFFSYFYLAMNIGTLLSQTLTPTLRGGIGCMGQDTCYPMAFGVATGAMVLATVVFLVGSSAYKKDHNRENMIGKVCQCILHALSEALKRMIKRREKVAIEKPEQHSHWLDYSTRKFGRPMVQDVKRVLDICVLFIPAVTFWALYDQMFSTWLIQTDAMNGRVGSVTILPDQLSMLFSIMIITVIPTLDKIVYPLCGKWNFLNTPLQKLGLGGFLAAASFILAGSLQVKVNETIVQSTSPGYIRHVIFNVDPRDSADINPTCLFNIFEPNNYSNPTIDLKIISIPHTNKYKDNLKHHFYEFLNCTGFNNVSNDNQTDMQFLDKWHMQDLDRLTVAWNRSGFNEDNIESPLPFSVIYFPKVKPINGYSRLYPMIDPYLVRSQNFTSIVIGQNGDVIKEFSLLTNEKEFLELKLPVFGSNIFDIYLMRHNFYMDDSSSEKLLIGQYIAASGSVDSLVIYSTNQNLTSTIVNLLLPNQVHLLWQVPQYFLMAAGEATFGISGMEFAYSQASTSMKSVMQAVWLLACMVGNLMAMIISGLHLIENPATEFFVYALLMLLFMVSFMSTSRKYKYVSDTSNEKLDASLGKGSQTKTRL